VCKSACFPNGEKDLQAPHYKAMFTLGGFGRLSLKVILRGASVKFYKDMDLWGYDIVKHTLQISPSPLNIYPASP
jgi:hypothetical protein